VALNLYRRHRQECEAGHLLESRSGEFDERKKGWKRCACFIFASGTLGGKFKRRYTGKSEWTEAKIVAAQWEAQGRWGGEIPPTPPTPASAPRCVTIEQAIKIVHGRIRTARRRQHAEEISPASCQLKAFCESRGYVTLDQWTPIDVREMRSSWTVSHQTAAKNMSTVKAFFEYCVSNEWLVRNPARLVKNQRSRDAGDKRGEQKQPFTDEELKRMYGACENDYGKQSRVTRTMNQLKASSPNIVANGPART
jgi:hypothetical protein